MARVRLTQGTSTNQLAGVAESQQAGDAVEHTQIPTTGTVPASWDHIAPDAISDISAEWPSAFASGFDLTAGDIWRENGEAGQAYVYAGDDVTVTAANFSSLEPVDDNPIWRQIAGHSLFNWPATAPANPFTILHGTIWNGITTDPGVFIWTGGDEEVTSTTYASFTPSTTSVVHDWRHLDAGDTTYNVFTRATDGLVPLSGAGVTTTTRYLREDGTWVVPPTGSGGGGSTVSIDSDGNTITIDSTPTEIPVVTGGSVSGTTLTLTRNGTANADLTITGLPSGGTSTGTANVPAFVGGTSYVVGDFVYYTDGSSVNAVYRNIVATSAGGTPNTNTTDWVKVADIGADQTPSWVPDADPGYLTTIPAGVVDNNSTVTVNTSQTANSGSVSAAGDLTLNIAADTTPTWVPTNNPNYLTAIPPDAVDSNSAFTINTGQTTSSGSVDSSSSVTLNLAADLTPSWVPASNPGYITSDDDTTYDITSTASGNNVNVNLNAGGSGSGTDSVLITAGTNITIDSVTNDGFTINSTASGGTFTLPADVVDSNSTFTINTDQSTSSGSVDASSNLTLNIAGPGDNTIGADELNVSGDGMDGQILTSAGNGSFTWETPTTSTGGLTQVTHDDTLNGRGTVSDPLGVSRLPIWSASGPTPLRPPSTYTRNDIVIDPFDNQLYMVNVDSIPIGGGTPVPNVFQIAYGSLTGFTDRRYIVEFELDDADMSLAPTIDTAATYAFIIDGRGIDVSFTVSGSHITTQAGFWVIDPDGAGTDYTVTAGATPLFPSTGFTQNFQASTGTGTPNARPGLDPTRWEAVSDTPIDYNARYSVAVGEVARWTEGATTLQGTVNEVLFEDVLAANSTVTGTGADVRYTVSGLLAADVAAMVAADRVMLTSGVMPLRTIGIATAHADPNTVVFQGTSLQSDSTTISDPAIVGNVILARGPITFRASFAEVTLIPESQAPTNLVEDFHSVADTAARTALTTTDVKFGDVVFQQDDQTFWEITHGTSPVGNFINFTWASSFTDGSRELALHFSDSATMPESADTYTLVSGGDTWSFLGSRVTTRIAGNGTIEWRVPDVNVRGSADRTAIDRAGTLTSSDAVISFDQILEETTVSLTEDNQTLTVTVDGVSASVQTRDIKFGSALPAVAHSVRGEVFATYTDGGQAIDLFIFNGTAWQLTDLTIDSLHVQGSSLFFEHPQIPGHTRTEITGTGNRNDAATVTDVRIQADVLRQELGHQVSPHGELEQEPGTSYRHVQGIELGGDFADDPNGTFRHARRVTRSVEYPTVLETVDANTSTNNSPNSTFGQTFTAVQAGLFPSAPTLGQQGSVHDTFRLQQYHGTNAVAELGLGGNTGQFIQHSYFMEDGGLADGPTDPSASPVNARYHVTDGGLIDTVPATGLVGTLHSGFTLGMVFSPNEAEAVPELVDEALWSMDFGARNLSDSRNVGVYLEETPGSGTIPVLKP